MQAAGALEAAVGKTAAARKKSLQVEGGPVLQEEELKGAAASLRQLLALKEAGNK